MYTKSKMPNRQVERTHSWVYEAIMHLLNDKPYNKITVTDIIEKAGIARRTFYRNFKDKDEAIINYFAQIFSSEFFTVESIGGKDNRENILLIFNIKYMIKNSSNLKKLMSAIEIESLFIDKFNEWQDMLIKQGIKKLNSKMQLVYKFKIYYQITGILRMIMYWFKSDMPMPTNDLTKLLNHFTVDTKTQYASVPNIIIKIIDN